MSTPLYDNIHWVGAVDWSIRDFHGYDAERGATYNAYLVRDEKTAIIDAVKAPFSADLLRNVTSLVDPSHVDYVVCNHAEPDHSGGLPEVMQTMPQVTVVCNKKCAAALSEHFDTSSWKFRLVTTGDALSLGRRTLQFIETPMVHWPESMCTYVPEEKLLFSMDIFGQHYATAERFDDEVDLAVVMDEAKTYYANIIAPYPKAVLMTLERLGGMEVGMIAPSHGLIWRRHGAEIVAAYRDWALQRPKPKVLVIYDTMWESTAAMAEAIVEGATQPGRERVADLHPPLQPHADCRGGARRGRGGVRQLDAQSRHDADGGRGAKLLAGPPPNGQGGAGIRFVWLGEGRSGGGRPGPSHAAMGHSSRAALGPLSAHARSARRMPPRRQAAGRTGRELGRRRQPLTIGRLLGKSSLDDC